MKLRDAKDHLSNTSRKYLKIYKKLPAFIKLEGSLLSSQNICRSTFGTMGL